MSPVVNQPKKKWPLWLKWGVGFAAVYTFLGLILYGNIASSWGEWMEIKTFSDKVFLTLGRVLLWPAFFVFQFLFWVSDFPREARGSFLPSFWTPFAIGLIFYSIIGVLIGFLIQKLSAKGGSAHRVRRLFRV